MALHTSFGLLPLIAATSIVMAAPEPDPVPRRWQLDVQVNPLRVAFAEVPGVGNRPFYYLTYKVTNTTGTEQTLAVSFELSTGAEDVQRAGRGVPQEVTKSIIEKLGNPLLQDTIGILGPIQHGRENAREGIVIWPLESFQPEQLVVYGAGFSGETAIIELPKAGGSAGAAEGVSEKVDKADNGAKGGKVDTKAEPKAEAKADGKGGKAPVASASSAAAKPADNDKVVLRKTKMIRYAVPGELTGLRDTPLKVEEERWVMR